MIIRLNNVRKQAIRLAFFSTMALATVNCAKKQVAAASGTKNDAEMATSTSTSEKAEYQSYVGRYEFEIDEIKWVEINMENNRLYGESEGRPKAELVKEGKDSFKVKGIDATITFTRSSEQKITGLVINYEGNEIPGKKVK